MTSIGERLRRARLEKNVPLESIARETRIGVRLLEAIEAEEFDRLPGGVFRKSFVIQYAQRLGFEAEAIASELKQLSAFEEPPNIPGQEVPRFGSDMPAIAPARDWTGLKNSLLSFGVVVAVVMACAGLYALWQYADFSAPREPVAPALSQPAAGQPTPALPPAQTGPAPSQVLPAPSELPPATAPSAPVQQAAAQTPEPSPAQPVRVDLSAGEFTWVQIFSDGRRIFSDSLRPRETKVIEASEKVRLLVGNAGGLEVSLNGKSIGPIGPRGQVRVVELTPAGFHIVQRRPPTEPL